jgi:hypothetical protein
MYVIACPSNLSGSSGSSTPWCTIQPPGPASTPLSRRGLECHTVGEVSLLVNLETVYCVEWMLVRPSIKLSRPGRSGRGMFERESRWDFPRNHLT